MLKGAKRKRSLTQRKGKRKAASPKVALGVSGPDEMSCFLLAPSEKEYAKQSKITGFFPQLQAAQVTSTIVYLDHNYVFTQPPTQGFSYANFKVEVQDVVCRGSSSSPAPQAVPKRPALKPAKKCQKSEEPAIKNSTLPDFFPVRRSLRKTLVMMKREKLKDIEDAILSGLEDGYEVKDFNGKGRGVVTLKTVKQGDFVLEYYGDLISRDEAKLREFLYSQDENVGCYMYYFTYNNKSYCVDATRESGRLGRLVNHCKKGNLSTKVVLVAGRPRLILVAKQNIAAGQELLYDYGDRSKRSLEYHPWLAS